MFLPQNNKNKEKKMYPRPIVSVPHKQFKHLTLEERFLIQFLHRRGSTAYAIAKEIGALQTLSETK